MSVRRVILCEDKHGGPFFKELTNWLKGINLKPHGLGVDVDKFYGPCNVKLERQLNAKALTRRRRFIIVVDGDGRSKADVGRRVAKHVPSDLRNVTRIIVLDHEIEDWICVSLGINISNKPSVILEQRFGYKKHHLKAWVAKLDIKRLMKCGSFHDFFNSL